jgi:NADH-quinone oxidoreductase subunit N
VNTPTFALADMVAVLPAAILSGGAILLMLSEVFLSSAARTYQALLALGTAMFAGVVAWMYAGDPARLILQDFAVQDGFEGFLTVVVCLGCALAVLLSAGFLKHRNAERGEFYALLLFASAGMSLLSLSAEFITLFVNLEVLSVATYALTAYLRRGPRPAEAGFKYFILGAFAAALTLYGAALLYGATGTTKLALMGPRLVQAIVTQPAMVYCGFGLVLAGLGFKIAAVPFHMWTPDVYEGAPTPVTALMSAGVKAAAFAAVVRVFMVLGHADPHFAFIAFSALAALTMVLGNLLALPQRNVKRMLAYSSIAHAGYLLLGVAALFAPQNGPAQPVGVMRATPLLGQSMTQSAIAAQVYQGILFYLLAYTVTSLGSFGVLSALERREDETRSNTWDLDRFGGLAQRKPWWAAMMAAFMLSLGGVPPTVGFMGKLLLFRAAIDAGLLGLTVLAVLASAAGIYYYLRVVVYMYMRPSPDGVTVPDRQWTTELALAASAIGVVLLGIAPNLLGDWLSKANLLFGG